MISFWQKVVGSAGVALALLLASTVPAGAAATKPAAPPPLFPLALAARIELPAAPLPVPSLGAGMAVVVLQDGDVVAFDLATGLERWRTALKATQGTAIAGDAIVIVTADSTECLSLADGAVRWRTPRVHAATAAPVVIGGLAVVATAQPALIGIDLSSGAPRWTRLVESPVAQPLLPGTDRVFAVTASHAVLAVVPASGEVRWTTPFTAPLSGLAEADGRLYVGSHDNYFYALDTSTGRIAWKWRTGGDVVGAAAVDAEHVYFASLDNLLRALDKRHGAQRWKRALPTRSVAGPLLIDDVLLVVGYSPEIRGHLPGTGAPAGRYGTDGEIAYPPLWLRGHWPGADRLVVITFDNTLLVLRRRFDPPVAPLEVVPGTPASATVPPPPSPAQAPPPLP